MPIAQGQRGPAELWQCWEGSGSSLERHWDRLLRQALADVIFAIRGKTALPRVANSSEMGRRGIVVFLLLCSIPQGTLLPPQVWLPPARAVCGC